MIARLLGLLGLVFISSLSANEQILSYHSQINIQRNGDLHVLETIQVRAQNQQIKRGIYRDFPTSYKDALGSITRVGFEVLSVKRDGKDEAYHLKNANNGQRVYMGQQNVLLEPGIYSYELEYKTDRQLGFFDDFDELYWNVTGNGWNFPIQQASAEIILPATVNSGEVKLTGYTGAQGSTEQYLTHRITDANRFYFVTTRALQRNQGLTIVASWPKGIIEEPSEQQKQALFIQDNKHQLIAVAGLLLVLAYYVVIWLKVGKDPQQGVIIPRYKAPQGFSPASMRYIHNMKYDNSCFTTALVNLTLKGAISIDQTESSLLKKGSFVVKKENRPGVQLAAGEDAILKALFQQSDEITLTQQEHKRIGKAMQQHRVSLSNDYEKLYFLTNKKYFMPALLLSVASLVYAIISIPDQQTTTATLFLTLFSFIPFIVIGMTIKRFIKRRNKTLSILNLALQSAFFGFFFFSLADLASELLSQLSSVAWPIVISAYLLIAINFLFEQWLKAPTLAGRKLLDKIEGLKRYLNVAESDEIELAGEPKFSSDIYEQFLPYAIALDVDHAWSRRLDNAIAAGVVESTYHPRGFRYYHAGLGMTDFSSSLSNSLDTAISSSSTAPGSSSGSSGGSSGGGGGGGGGGGW